LFVFCLFVCLFVCLFACLFVCFLFVCVSFRGASMAGREALVA
jgi:hypothetical protein